MFFFINDMKVGAEAVFERLQAYWNSIARKAGGVQ